MKNVTNENFKRAEAELKKQAEELANKVAPTPAIPEIQEVEADLKDFSLIDNGDNYLSVTHKALHDATIGVVSKNEYAKGNKEALLRSVLENKFAEYTSTHSLKIVGQFVEPNPFTFPKKTETNPCKHCSTPVPASQATNICETCLEKYNESQAAIEPAKEITSDLPLLRSADAFRQNIEREAFKSQEAFNKFIASTVNNLVAHIKALRYDNPKVTEAIDASNLYLGDGGINGHLVISASLEDSKGPKYLNIPVPVTASKAVFPNEKEMVELVSKALDLRAKLEEKLALETLTAMAKVDAEEAWAKENISNIISEKAAEITKEASDYTDGISSTDPGAHIKLQKHLLPGELADWEVGDTVVADGKKWKLVSKGDGIDSNDKNAGSASLWDFVECLPEEGDEKIKADLPR